MGRLVGKPEGKPGRDSVGKGEEKDPVGKGKPMGKPDGKPEEGPEGRDPVGKGRPVGKPEGGSVGRVTLEPVEVGMMMKFPPPRTLEIISESSSMSGERMELESRSPAPSPPDRVKARPMMEEGCPITTVTFTLSTRPSKTVEITSWIVVDRLSSKPTVRSMLIGPTSMRPLRSRPAEMSRRSPPP